MIIEINHPPYFIPVILVFSASFASVYFNLMYSKREASLLRKNFWTQFGQYMRPLRGATGEPVNWLNYKTGARHIYFRLDAGVNQATIAIELRHPDASQQVVVF